MALKPYDSTFVPAPFGLHNTGVICHFNSLLQGLASCPVFLKTVMENKDYMFRTNTGKAFYAFVSAIANKDGAKAAPDQGIEGLSAQVMHAFVTDLRARRPSVRFGSEQECADEGLVFLLDMMEPPVEKSPDDAAPGAVHETKEDPLTQLFLHKYICQVYCTACNMMMTSTKTDLGVQFSLGYMDRLKVRPSTEEGFSETIRRVVSLTEDYFCPHCKKKVEAYRYYRLTLIPEIVVCLFDIYRPPRPRRYVPMHLIIPGAGKEDLLFKLVSASEQTGSMHGGHYTAQGIRRSTTDTLSMYSFNDSSSPVPIVPSAVNGNENKYLVFYNYEKSVKASASPAPLPVRLITAPPVTAPTQSSSAAGEKTDEVSDLISELGALSMKKQ